MKVQVTLEYEDLIERIKRSLAMEGVQPRIVDGEEQIQFDEERKQIVVECEIAAVPTTCLFCGRSDAPSAPIARTTAAASTAAPSSSPQHAEVSEAVPQDSASLTLEEINAQSQALARQGGPLKRIAARAVRMENESYEYPGLNE